MRVASAPNGRFCLPERDGKRHGAVAVHMTVSATREFEQKISVQQGKDNPQYPLEEVLRQ
jgi:hypothetical protein